MINLTYMITSVYICILFGCFKVASFRSGNVCNSLSGYVCNLGRIPPQYRIKAVHLNFNNFGDNAVKVLMLSQEEARRTFHNQIGSEHIFQGLLRIRDGVAHKILNDFNVTLAATRDATSVSLPAPQGSAEYGNQTITFSPNAKEALEYSSSTADRLGASTIETEHLLLGICNDKSPNMIVFFGELQIDPAEVERETYKYLEDLKKDLENKSLSDNISNPFALMYASGLGKDPLLASTISAFTTDLIKLAREGAFHKAINRDALIDRAIRTLCRKTKSNVVLIGDPGVGKTAIAEGIALKIAQGESISAISKKNMLSLDVGMLLAGTKFRGQFEERLTKLLEDIKEMGSVILVVDEAHMLIGAGSGEGAIDAANLLKPALARGEIQCIAITTPKEYKKYFERDQAFARRFQPIHVEEPSEEDTIDILNELSGSYGKFHNVVYTPEAIKLAATYSKQYILDRYLPDKAIDVLDESGSLAKLMYQKENVQVGENEPLGTVNTEHVAEIVSSWAGIPLGKLTSTELDSVRNLEAELQKTIIGQDEAVENVCKAIRRAKSHIKNPDRPIGTFLFCGPPGVGKSQVAKALSNHMFSHKNNMIRLDMSEYSEPHSISKLIGSPPGYKGHDAGGQLTEKVRKTPYCVVMFDEVEKAHPDVLSVLLQILEDGKLTDARNQAASFKNTIVILTSNMGSNVIKRATRGIFEFGFNIDSGNASNASTRSNAADESNYAKVKMLVMEELKSQLKPELVNRIDEIVLFKPLEPPELLKIAHLMVDEVVTRAKAAGLHLTVKDNVYAEILKIAAKDTGKLNHPSGARPLRRAITIVLEDPLAELIISPSYQPGAHYVAQVGQDSKVEIHMEPITTPIDALETA